MLCLFLVRFVVQFAARREVGSGVGVASPGAVRPGKGAIGGVRPAQASAAELRVATVASCAITAISTPMITAANGVGRGAGRGGAGGQGEVTQPSLGRRADTVLSGPLRRGASIRWVARCGPAPWGGTPPPFVVEGRSWQLTPNAHS